MSRSDDRCGDRWYPHPFSTRSDVAISSESYGYDSASNMTGKTVDSVATTYGYDAADQLTSESRTGYSASYTYDANGNRATKTLGGITDTYHLNDVDELTSITRAGWLTPVKSYTYDNAGRTTAVTTSVGTTSLSYDVEGRLTQITYPSTATNTFTYNALDTRVGKVDSAGTATYKRDGASPVAAVLSDGSAGFTPGVSERRGGASQFYHQNNLGSVTRLTDSSQATTATKAYDAFGNLIGTSGSTTTPFGFAGGFGYETDAESGLLLLGHRYYDPSTGRFLTRDPARDGRNWYAYCRNSPCGLLDKTGHTPVGPPPFPIPGGAPGAIWRPILPSGPGRRGKWVPSPPVRTTRGGQPEASWDEEGHWDLNDGTGGPRRRFDEDGNEISAEQAHGGPEARPVVDTADGPSAPEGSPWADCPPATSHWWESDWVKVGAIVGVGVLAGAAIAATGGTILIVVAA